MGAGNLHPPASGLGASGGGSGLKGGHVATAAGSHDRPHQRPGAPSAALCQQNRERDPAAACGGGHRRVIYRHPEHSLSASGPLPLVRPQGDLRDRRFCWFKSIGGPKSLNK